jgi:hypothetical protein
VNLESLFQHLLAGGLPPLATVQLLRSFNGYSPEFRAASQKIEAQYPAGDSAARRDHP